jgi:hypothetical protein
MFSLRCPQAVQDYILLSEFATLVYLHRIGVPAPTVHGYGLMADTNGVGVNYILMDKLQASPLRWHNLGPDGRHHILRQLAKVFISLERNSFRQTGSIQPQASIAAFADRVAFGANHSHETTPLGPFGNLHEHLEHTITCYLRLIESSQWAVDDSVSSYLIYRSLLDVFHRVLPANSANGHDFYLRHQDDKGDHILVNEEVSIVGIIDWEGSKVVGKPFAFSAPVMLLPRSFDEGNNQLSRDEEDLAQIFDSLGRSDMAACIRDGRAAHRIWFILDGGDRPEACKPHLKGLYQLLGEENWDWETWRLDALRRYQTDPVLQRLLARAYVI